MLKTLIIAFLIIVTSCNLSQKLRKTEWTIPEVKEWAIQSAQVQGWKGMLLYQGSDSIFHHYISRVMDEWAWFKIKRFELSIVEERIYNTSSSAAFGYYYVDPSKNFTKTGDYKTNVADQTR